MYTDSQRLEIFLKYADSALVKEEMDKMLANKAFSPKAVDSFLKDGAYIFSASHCALLYLSKEYEVLEKIFISEQYENSDFSHSMAASVFFKAKKPHLSLGFIRKIKDPQERMLRLKSVELWQNIYAEPQNEPRVHLLILSYNRVEYVKKALKELAATDYKNYAVYIADNGSSDGSWDIVKKSSKIFPEDIPVYVERLPTNIGRPAGHNWLLTNYSHKEADYIAIGDDDLVSVPKDWMRLMVNTFKAIPNCGCVGGKALSPGKPLRVHGGIRNFVKFGDGQLNLSNDKEQNDCGQFDYIDIVDHVIGCLHIFDRRILEKTGLFDIALSPCQYVDIEHHLRMNFTGYNVAFNGLIAFEHWRAMGKNTGRSRKLHGNSIANALKVYYSYDTDKAVARLKKRQEIRNQWLFKGTARQINKQDKGYIGNTDTSSAHS